ADPGEAALHQGTRGRGPRERPEADAHQPGEPVEDDLRRGLADERDEPAHRVERVLDHDDRIGALRSDLLGKPVGRPVVALADARAEDENPGWHGRQPYRSAKLAF